MKDPRLLLFADAWRRVLPEASWIVIYRHPAQCHDSLARRHARALLLGQGEKETALRFWREPDLAWRMWLAYHTHLLPALEQVSSPVLVLSHQALLDERSGAVLVAASAVAGVDVSSQAEHLHPERSGSGMCQPPLDEALVIEVDAMWARLARLAGDFADRRDACVLRGGESRDAGVPVRGWEEIGERLRAKETDPNAEHEVCPGEPATEWHTPFDGPKVALRQAEYAPDPVTKLAILSAGIRQFPRNFWLHRALGLFYRMRGAMAEARECLEHAAGLDPAQPVIWCELASLALTERRFEDALDSLINAWPLVVSRPELLGELCLLAARIHEERRNRAEALAYAEAAVELRPDWRQARRYLDRLRSPDDPRAYLDRLQAAWCAGETDAGVALPLARSLLQYGRTFEARQVIEDFLGREPGHRVGQEIFIAILRSQSEIEHARVLERGLWLSILTEPGTLERVMGLRDGLDEWAAFNLGEKLHNHCQRILGKQITA